MTDSNEGTPRPERTSGWERADRVAHGAGKVLEGTAWVMAKGYGVLLVIVGLILFFISPGTTWWISLLLIAYGVYLLAPGSKFVVW